MEQMERRNEEEKIRCLEHYSNGDSGKHTTKLVDGWNMNKRGRNSIIANIVLDKQLSWGVSLPWNQKNW